MLFNSLYINCYSISNYYFIGSSNATLIFDNRTKVEFGFLILLINLSCVRILFLVNKTKRA